MAHRFPGRDRTCDKRHYPPSTSSLCLIMSVLG
jgi:hypothetical protein